MSEEDLSEKKVDHELLKKRRLEKEHQDKKIEEITIQKRMDIAEKFVATYGGLPSFAKPIGNGNWDIESPELAEKEMAKYRLHAKIRQSRFNRTKEASKDAIVDTVYKKMEAKEKEYEEQQEKEKLQKGKERNKKVRRNRNKNLVKQMEDNLDSKTFTSDMTEETRS